MAQKEKFFKKWENEKWFFISIFVVVIYTLLVFIRSMLFQYSLFESFWTIFADLFFGILMGPIIGLLVVPVVSEVFLNIGAVIVSLLKNQPGEYRYPLRFDDYVISRFDERYCFAFLLLGVGTMYVVSPIGFYM